MTRAQSAAATWLVILLVFAPAIAVADNEGLDDLDKAIEQKLAVRSLNDLGKTIDLLQAALNKGLDDQNTTLAHQLLGEALLERATVLTRGLTQPSPGAAGGARARLWKIAVADAQRVLQLQAESPRAQLLLGRLLPLGGRTKEALEALDACVDSATDEQTELLAQALTLRGTLRSDKQKRKADLDRAVELSSNPIDALRARAGLFQEQGELDAALADLKRAIELAPEAAAVYEAQAGVLAAKEDFDAAIEILDKAIQLAPKSATAYTQRAQLRFRKGQLKLALDDLNKAVQFDPRDFRPLALRANALLLSGDTAGAKEDIDKVLHLQPGFPPALRLRAEILAQGQQLAEAIASLKGLAEANPSDRALQIQLGRYYLADQQIDVAIAIFSKQLEDKPDDGDAARFRGDTYLAVGRQAEALADYRTALKLDPDHSGLLNNLAWVLATSPDEQLRDGSEAIRLATKACEVTEYKAYHILSTLAAAYAEAGNFEKALEWSQKAVELGKESPQLADLKKELDSYRNQKPWRELQAVEPKKPNGTDAPSSVESPPADATPDTLPPSSDGDPGPRAN